MKCINFIFKILKNYVVYLLILLNCVISNNQFNIFISQVQEYLKETSYFIQNKYNNKCDIIKNKNCFKDSCQELMCSNKYAKIPEESQNFNSESTCVSDLVYDLLEEISKEEDKLCKYSYVNLKESSVNISYTDYPVLNKFSSHIKEDICYTYSLNDNFKNIYNKESKFKFNNNELANFQYFGTKSGVLRVYPGFSSCMSYDHTKSEWFNRAIRRPINILLAIDFSGGMNNSGKKQLLLKAVKSFLDNIDDSMWIGLLPMMKYLENSKNSVYPKTNSIIRANKEGKNLILEMIENAEFFGEYNFNDNLVTEYIIEFKKMNLGVNCYNNENFKNSEDNFVYMNDTLLINFSGTRNVIDTSTDNKNIEANHDSIYVSVGEESNNFFINKQSNKNSFVKSKDIYIEINSPSDINLVIQTFNSYSSLGVIKDNVIWKVLDDSFGFGKVLSASIPVYTNNSELLGVYGIDFSINKIKNQFPGYESDLEYYFEKNGECGKYTTISLCDIEELRNIKFLSDSKLFEKKCIKEKEAKSTNLCLLDTNLNTNENIRNLVENNSLIDNIYSDNNFYCSTIKSNINTLEKDIKDRICCLNENELLKSNISYLLENSNIDLANNNFYNDTVKNTNDSNINNLISPLEDNNVNLLENNDITSSQNISVANSENLKDINSNINQPKKENKSLFFVIILIIGVMLFVIWHLRKNQPRAYTNNNELLQSMNQSNRSNFYT